MRTALTALSLTKTIPSPEGDYIGVDRGALILAKAQKRMKLAIGDFDSVEREDMAAICAYADEVIRLNPVKDISDSEAALNELKARGYERIILFGALGSRMDHALVNIALAFENPGLVYITDEANLIYALAEGRHAIQREAYTYISFFTQSAAVITLENMKYPLDHELITANTLFTLSNEITGEEGILTVHEGTVLVIQSNDRK